MTTKEEILGMKVSGNIISELSDRIPNNFMAINELIKNAYDADATMVEINISTIKKEIVILDDGCGMDKHGMENLLHIARSNKNYAIRRPNGRITQGEKGLGALATFHFGNKVTWETSQDNTIAYKFTVSKNDITDKDDISEYQTTIEELRATFKGTQIRIRDIENEEFIFITETLKNKKTTSKLVRSLYDSNGISAFKVNFCIDGETYIHDEDLKVNDYNRQEQIYHVEYDSSNSDNKITFYYKNVLVFKKEFILDKLLSGFRIKCNLDIFDLGGKISNAHFPALYHKEQERPDITPLVYINQGFFKNYILFDVDIVRQVRSGEALAQMIGEVEIRTQSEKLLFNADRTEINENIITAKLKAEIMRLNETIQKTGSAYKRPFIEMNRDRLPMTVINSKRLNITGKTNEQIEVLVDENIANKVYRELITCEISNDKAIYSFLGKELEARFFKEEEPTDKLPIDNLAYKNPKPALPENINSNRTIPASIGLKSYFVKLPVNTTGQINLYEYIVEEKTVDSSGETIPLHEIIIKDNKGLMKTTNILPAITVPQEVKITYIYDDKITGIESKELAMEFFEPAKLPMRSKTTDNYLIHTHGIGGFSVSFDNVSGKLVDQINRLNINEYAEVIACSLRSLFELGIDAIRNKNTSSSSLNALKNSISAGNSLDNNVKLVVAFCKLSNNRGKIVNYLNLSCTNVNFHTLDNIADSDRISKHAAESNLGAHKGTRHLTKQQIIDIANDASTFQIFVEGIIGAADNF